MNAEFENIANTSSSEVSSVINAMVHTKKELARPMINVLNTIIDYYITRKTQSEEICYPIIYIPHVPEWAREVWLKYLIIKLSLYYNNDNRVLLKQFLNSTKNVELKTEDDEKYYKKYLKPCRQYIRNILQETTDNFIGENGHKNLIVCAEDDIRVSREDKNVFINKFYGDIDAVYTDYNLVLSHKLDADEVRSQLREHRDEEEIYIDNLFIFYTNNDKVNSMELTALERWNNAYHVGLKNCFIFIFSEEPFRLNYIWHKGISLSKRFPMVTEKDFYNYRHFITFDESETNYLFNRKNNYEHKLIPDDQLLFSDVLGSLLDESEYRIQERNRFALCLSPEIATYYKSYLADSYTDFDEESYQLSFDWQIDSNAPKVCAIFNDVVSSINDYQKNIAVVVDKTTTKKTKQALTVLFQSFDSGIKVKYYDYSALKPVKKERNEIKESIVFVLQYRPHYVRQMFAKYPNSYDPMSVRKGQYIYDIIQGFVFNDMYEWDRYDYDKAMHDLFNSEFRLYHIGEYNKPSKPTIRRVTGEMEFSDERGVSAGIVYVRGLYDTGEKFSMPETNYVICNIDNETIISRLSDLKRQGVLNSVAKMQELDDISEQLKTIIEKKVHGVDEREKSIRQSQYKHGKISEQERDSETALWKILLSKKIKQEGVAQAYNAVMDGLKDNERIQINQFKKWADYDNDMILPLLKVCQRKLFEYIGFGLTSPYLAIMRSKKLAAKNGTRKYNSMIADFLRQTLLVEIDEDVYETIESSEINELLMLQNIGDLNALVSILREDICLRAIKTIE